MRKQYKSSKNPIMGEIHVGAIFHQGPSYVPTISNPVNIDKIVDDCIKDFSKFKNLLQNTENRKIVEEAKRRINGTVRFSQEEKDKLLEIIENKKYAH